jgi:hypothetical protein
VLVDQKRRRRAAVFAVTLGLCLLPFAGTNAASIADAVNHPGTLGDQPEIDCQPDDMWVSRPLMQPASVQYNPPGFSVGDMYSIPPQWVAFRADLAWWNGSQWVAYREGAWFYQQASTTPLVLADTTSNPWFEWYTRQAASYTLGFWDLPNSNDYGNPNYYAVYYQYQWFKDQFRDAGSFTDWTHNHKDNRAQPAGTFNYDRNSTDFCKYPGPNWITNVN